MENFLKRNIKAIEAGGGYVDVAWLESDAPAPDGITSSIERGKSGLPNIFVTVKKSGKRQVFAGDSNEQSNRLAEKFKGMAGRHGIVYGLGAGRHLEEALRAVGDSGEVTVFECSRLTARESLGIMDIERFAAHPNVRIFIGPGRDVVPRAMSRVRELERAKDELQTKLFVHRTSLAALPRSEHAAREFIRRFEGGFYLEGGQNNPLMREAFYAIQKNIFRGGPLSDIEMAFLFVETVREDGRYFYFDSDYERTPIPENISRLLVISLSAIGDAVIASAVLPGLREKYPDARIVFLTENPSMPLFEHSGLIDRVMSYSRGGIIKDFADAPEWKNLIGACEKFLQVAGELREEKFDTVINTHPTVRSAIISGMLDLPPERTIGYSVGRDGVGVVRGNLWQRLRIIGNAKLDMAREDNAILMFDAATADRRTAAIIPEGDDGPWALPEFISHPKRGKAIGISPFVSNPTRSWGLDRFLALCKLIISETDRDLIIFAGFQKEERALVKMMFGELGARATLCAGQPLDRAAWVARECALFITNDTGPMHFAAAAGARCLALLGSTHILPYNPIGHIGVIAYLACTNCCRRNPCKEMNCFRMIEPAHVAEFAATMLEHGPDGALSELAGLTGPDKLCLITTGTHASLTPRYSIVLRGPDPHESNVACEFSRIAVFNVMRLLEAGALDSGRHPRGADQPGLASPFSPETAARDVLRRHCFIKSDPVLLKNFLDSQLEIVESSRRLLARNGDDDGAPHPIQRFVSALDAMEISHKRDRALDLCAEFLSSVKNIIS